MGLVLDALEGLVEDQVSLEMVLGEGIGGDGAKGCCSESGGT